MAKKQTGKQKPQVAEAAGSASSSSGAGYSAADIEKAMSEAAATAQAEGITDPDEIRARMLEARRAVKEPDRAPASGED